MSSNGILDPTYLLEETVWFDASKLRDAEARYEEYLANERRANDGQGNVTKNSYVPKKEATPISALANEVANVRTRIQNFIKATDIPDSSFPGQILQRIQHVEQENATFKKTIAQMSSDMQAVLKKLNALDIKVSHLDMDKVKEEKIGKNEDAIIKNGNADDDEDIDLFGSDEETEEDRRIKEERLKAYESKKAKKTQVIAKSSVVLDVKPWSDETDLKEMETNVRKIESVGLKWGAAKLVPLAYGIKKLQIIAIVEDDNCSIDWLQEQIEAIEDLVQSVDIAAFNKL